MIAGPVTTGSSPWILQRPLIHLFSGEILQILEGSGRVARSHQEENPQIFPSQNTSAYKIKTAFAVFTKNEFVSLLLVLKGPFLCEYRLWSSTRRKPIKRKPIKYLQWPCRQVHAHLGVHQRATQLLMFTRSQKLQCIGYLRELDGELLV